MKFLMFFTGIIIMAELTNSHSHGESEIKYRYDEIPKELLVNARSVIRKEVIDFEVVSEHEAVKKVQYAITVLNTNGIDDSNFLKFYNKFSKIHDINAAIYDENGKKIKNFYYYDIKDYSLFSNYSLYEDSRCKFIDPKYRNLPFTIEYSYEESFSGLIDYPDWLIQPDYNISVQYKEFNVTVPRGSLLRYYIRNPDSTLQVISKHIGNWYHWQVSGVNALKQEQYALPLEDVSMGIMIAPGNFEMDGYPGNSGTWQNFGKWIYALNKDKNQLNEESSAKIKTMISGTTSDLDKIKILYEYLQNKTRYVSIQIGIGGWQPFDAETVDRLSYGDCKALSNYMKSLLDIAGIRSFYTLVKAGENASNIVREFPSNQFNHAIICVPFQSDTLWLECTSQHTPCGYTGSFTDDRDVLVITDSGGVVTHSETYSILENQKQTLANVNLLEDGKGQVEIINRFKGIFYEDMFRMLFNDNENRKNLVLKELNIPDFELTDFNLYDNRKGKPECIQKLDLKLNNYGIITSNKMIIRLNLLHKTTTIPVSTFERKSDILIRRSFIDTDSVFFNIPENYMLDSYLAPVEIHSLFGEFSAQSQLVNNKLLYIRSFKMFKGRFSRTSYGDLVDFFDNIAAIDEKRAVFIRK